MLPRADLGLPMTRSRSSRARGTVEGSAYNARINCSRGKFYGRENFAGQIKYAAPVIIGALWRCALDRVAPAILVVCYFSLSLSHRAISRNGTQGALRSFA